MKRIICTLLIIAMCFSVCACTNVRNNYKPVVAEESDAIDFSSSVTVVSPPTPVAAEVVYTPEPTPEPTPTPIPEPTPTVVIVNTNTNASANPITKSPYDDIVQIGGTVKFVATANNYSSIKWKIKSPDSKVINFASNAPGLYTGLSVSGENTTTLVLSNVPASMNGCLIQCVFTVNGSDYYTNNALLTVIGAVPTATPTAAPTDYVLVNANTCHDQYAVYATSEGYTTSGIRNYYVAESIASFNIDFISTAYLIRGEFTATDSSFRPVHVYVYDPTGTTFKRDIVISTASEFQALLKAPEIGS